MEACVVDPVFREVLPPGDNVSSIFLYRSAKLWQYARAPIPRTATFLTSALMAPAKRQGSGEWYDNRIETDLVAQALDVAGMLLNDIRRQVDPGAPALFAHP